MAEVSKAMKEVLVYGNRVRPGPHAHAKPRFNSTKDQRVIGAASYKGLADSANILIVCNLMKLYKIS